jgi:pimeloyl-ACP methyl ester carboxylesterase
MTFILIHGSWHNGSAWHKIEKLLKQQQVAVLAPTLSGFESFDQPATREIGLHTNIQDIVDLIVQQDLNDVILVGHSYSGLVISGVAEQVPERIAKLIYLDAFIPDDNQSLFDIIGKESEQYYRGIAVGADGKGKADGVEDGWLLPPGQPQDYGVTDPEDVAWLRPRMVYTPIRTFEEAVRIENPAAQVIPRVFIRCTDFPYLQPFEKKAKELGWEMHSINTGHDAMLTEPEEVVRILSRCFPYPTSQHGF